MAWQPPCHTLLIVPTIFQSSISALSNRSAFHTDYCVLCRVLSYAPTAPALPPGNPALSSYIPRSDCGLYYCFPLSAPTGTPVYQILHFLICFVKVCICYDFSTQPYHNFLFHIGHIYQSPFPIGSIQRHVSDV